MSLPEDTIHGVVNGRSEEYVDGGHGLVMLTACHMSDTTEFSAGIASRTNGLGREHILGDVVFSLWGC